MLAATLAAGYIAMPAANAIAQVGDSTASPLLYEPAGCLSGQGQITIQGRNFARNRAVDVWDYYDQGMDPLYGNSAPATTTDFGTFSAVLQIDLHPAAYHHIIAVYHSDSPFDEQASLVVGYCGARVGATPLCSNGHPKSIAIDGEGFQYSTSTPVNLTIYRQPDFAVVGSDTVVDGFLFDVVLYFDPGVYPNGAPPGIYKIVASQGEDPFNTTSAETWFSVPCPTAAIVPLCGAAGTPPTLGTFVVQTAGFIDWPGQGFDHVEIVVDTGGRRQEFWTDDVNGSFQVRPFRRPTGSYTIKVKQGYFGGSVFGNDEVTVRPARTDLEVSRATTSLIVPCPPATPSPTPTPSPSASPTPSPGLTTLTIDPACGAPQLDGDSARTYELTVKGSGFRPGRVKLTFDPDGSSQEFGATLRTGTAFSQLVTADAVRDGTHRVVAHQDVVGSFVPDAEATFTVPCMAPAPALTSDPCGPSLSGIPQAYLINLTGSGFLPGRVDLTFDAGGSLPELMTPAFADANGSFAAPITPNGRGPGDYLIAAHQQVAGSDLVVDASVVFLVACEGPAFRLIPDNGPRGFVLLVTGTDFPPSADIILRWNRGLGAGRQIVAHTDGNGAFTRQVLIFSTDFTGQREMHVELADNPLAFATVVPAKYRVTAGTISPPFRLAGNPFADPDATIVIRR